MPTIQLKLSIQYGDASTDWQNLFPRPMLRRWVKAAVAQDAHLTLRWVDTEEGKFLNHTYRGKDYATNVLTFNYHENNADVELNSLPTEVRQALIDSGEWVDESTVQADIVLCGAVLLQEAKEQGKTIQAHVAHLVVHGVLHAQGFDHILAEDAEKMEQQEIFILHKLGFDNPYTAPKQ